MNKSLKRKNNQTDLIPKLSNTVRLLGEILGLVIKKQEGTSLFNKVENIEIPFPQRTVHIKKDA